MKTSSRECVKLSSLIKLLLIVLVQLKFWVALGRSQSVRANGNEPRNASIATQLERE
jgi:hypothetical protein